MLMTDAMVGSHQPGLQISEDEVDEGNNRIGKEDSFYSDDLFSISE
jgi:hypothetical protein